MSENRDRQENMTDKFSGAARKMCVFNVFLTSSGSKPQDSRKRILVYLRAAAISEMQSHVCYLTDIVLSNVQYPCSKNTIFHIFG